MPYAHECGCRIVYDRVPSPLPAENLSQGLVHIEGYPENTYFWPLTETQSRRLSSLLDIDFNSLGIAGSLIQSPELICTYCGKLSGLEDFVHAALQTGVHSADFVIENLKAGGNSPNGHKQILNCCDCGRPYLRSGTDEEVATRTRVELARRHSLAELEGDASMESDAEEAKSEHSDHPAIVAWSPEFPWIREKRNGQHDDNERDASTTPAHEATAAWYSGSRWLMRKKDPEETPNMETTVTGTHEATAGWIGVGSWAMKKRDLKEATDAEAMTTGTHEATAGWAGGSWIREKSEVREAIVGWGSNHWLRRHNTGEKASDRAKDDGTGMD